jgi:four helix bundle protein
MMSYEKLDVYQIAMQFLALAIKLVSQFPPGHSDLADQLKRAAMSISQNIGEGAGKRTPADCRKYFDTARGSAMECGVHLDICATLGLASSEMISTGKELLTREVAMLTRLSQRQGLSRRPSLRERQGLCKRLSPRPLPTLMLIDKVDAQDQS